MLHLNLIHHACLEKVHRNLTKDVQLKLTYIILTINFTFNVPFSCLHARNFFTLHLDKKIKTFRRFFKP